MYLYRRKLRLVTNMAKDTKKLWIIGAFLILLYLIASPLLLVLCASMILVTISYPLYFWLRTKVRYDALAALLTLLTIIIVMLLPFSLIAYKAAEQSSQFLEAFSHNLEQRSLFGIPCMDQSVACYSLESIQQRLSEVLLSIHANTWVEFALARMVMALDNYLIKIPQKLLGTSLVLLFAFLIFKYSQWIQKYIQDMLHLTKKEANDLFVRFRWATSMVFFRLVCGIAMGTLGFIGFWLAQVPFAIFWAVIMAFFSLLPLLGPPLVWIPLSTYSILNGILQGEIGMIVRGGLLIVYGILVIGTTDHKLNQWLSKKDLDIHPMLIIIGVIAGIKFFGTLGLILGPVIVTMVMTYHKKRANLKIKRQQSPAI